MGINPVVIVKGVLELAASAGTGIVVGNLVKATTPDDISKFQKVMIGIGSYTIGAVLSDLSAKHISSTVDNYNEKLQAILHPESEQAELTAEPLADWEVDLIREGEDVVHDGAENVKEAADKVAKKTKPDTDNK